MTEERCDRCGYPLYLYEPGSFQRDRHDKTCKPFVLDPRVVPGAFVKVTGARDGVGLRKIVEIREFEHPHWNVAVVDHYQWEHRTGPNGKKIFTAVRKPYASEVMLSKIRIIYTLNENNELISQDKVTTK
jgi:hypothetical protein